MNQIISKKLDTGVEVVVDQMAGTECVSINASFFVGSGHQKPDEDGMAHFLEHIMFKGNHQNAGVDIQNRMERLGGYMNASTDWDTTSYEVIVLKENLEPALSLLATLLTTEHLSLSDIDFEKSIVIEEIRTRGSSSEVLEQGFYEAAYGDHSVSMPVIGIAENVKNIDAFQLMSFKEQHYVAENFAIAIAGDVNPDEAFDAVEKNFSQIKSGERSQAEPMEYIGGEVQFACPCDSGIVELGFPMISDNKDFYGTNCVLNQILGGGSSSRLFLEIREKRGLAYDAHSFHNCHLGQRLMVMSAHGHSNSTKDIFQIMCEEFEKIAHSVSEEEVEQAKTVLIAYRRMHLDYLNSRAGGIIENISEFGYVRNSQEIIDDVKSVTPEKVMQCAKNVFAQQATLAVHGTVRNMPKLRDYTKSPSIIAA